MVFLIHDFEEIIYMETWFARHYHKFRHKIPSPFLKITDQASKVTTQQFALAVLVELLFLVIATLIASEGMDYLLFLGVNIIMLLHVFMHIGQSIYLRRFVPGVLTAIFFILPYSLYLFYRLLVEKVVSWSDIVISIPFGFLLVPIVLFGHYLAGKLLKTND
ncbi:HXXEE domain-containing protein [Shimazuella alba]|uniref:HXXEE domain-containing protein n=1 Tax=Shimazuella alba TaxID=2690964 RepID=UPI0030845440